MMLLNKRQIVCIVSLLFLFAGCGQDDAQREFEEQAFSLPDGITRTNDRGEVVDGEEDPDDWRVSPLYEGLIFVNPPYPNPVLTNDRITLDIELPFVDTVNGLRVFVLYDLNRYQELDQSSALTLVSFILQPARIAQFPEQPEGTYRIIVEDFRGHIVTYGDIEIQ